MANGNRTWDANRFYQTAGFSLIELLIVIAIVVVIVAIAIPNLMRSKVAANEASAIGSLRNIMSAEAAYKAMYGVGYSNDLASIGGTATADADASCSAAELLDAGLAKGVIGNKTRKSGYLFTFTPGKEAFKPDQAVTSGCEVGKADGYAVQADPLDSQAGKRHFCADASGVIRFDTNREIDVTAPTCAGSAAPLQ